jgi:hypothetical protein
MAQVKVFGVDQTIAELRLLDENLIKDLRKDLRVAVEPIATSIKAYIPNQPPLRGKNGRGGMQHNGRTSWQPSSVKVSVKTSFSRRTITNEQGLVSIWVGGKKGENGAAALQIADMAGKRGKASGGVTREYDYKGGTRRHRKNGQGRAMMDYLNGRYSTASRFVWRGAMLQLPAVQSAVLLSLEKASAKVNARLVKM